MESSKNSPHRGIRDGGGTFAGRRSGSRLPDELRSPQLWRKLGLLQCYSLYISGLWSRLQLQGKSAGPSSLRLCVRIAILDVRLRVD